MGLALLILKETFSCWSNVVLMLQSLQFSSKFKDLAFATGFIISQQLTKQGIRHVVATPPPLRTTRVVNKSAFVFAKTKQLFKIDTHRCCVQLESHYVDPQSIAAALPPGVEMEVKTWRVPTAQDKIENKMQDTEFARAKEAFKRDFLL